MKHKIVLFSALLFAVSLKAQLTYTSDVAPISLYDGYKADGAFVSTTLLNLGSISSFTKGGLTFSLIPNLDSSAPSDLQVGGGFTADVKMLAENHADTDNFGAESSLIGLGSQTLYTFGATSATTWHISALLATDLIFWTQDLSFGAPTKFDMSDPLHFRTFAATDANFSYFIFAVDDRGSQLVDYNDGVFGIRLNLRPTALESVPEPSTYGLMSGAVLCGLIVLRRIRSKSAVLSS